MNERIWKVLEHRATRAACWSALGFTAGAMFGYWRTSRQYKDLDAGLEKAMADTERIEQFQFDFKDAAIEAEVNRRVKAHVSRMNDILGYDTATSNEESLIALRQDHPAFDDDGTTRIITSARIDSVSLHTDGNGLPETGITRVVHEDGRVLYPVKDEPIGRITEIKETDIGIEVSGIVTNQEKFDELARPTVTSNIFDVAGDEWDYKTEIEHRDRSAPYVIHVDEFVNDEMGWDSQSTLTYFEEDDILCDSHDTPIYDYKKMTGELRFGHGSNDPNVVYIRNEQLEAEYEILRNPGSYEMTVLGERMTRAAQIDELKHSATPRFRPE